MKKLLTILISALICISQALAEQSAPMNPGGTFMPRVIESGRDLMHLYPSSNTLILPELNKTEEQEITDLIQDKNRAYVALEREVSVTVDNWELVGSKNTFDIWQLHIKSPNAIAMQAFFEDATLFSGLDVKIYSGEEGVSSHIGEHRGNNSQNAESYWSTKVPGNTIVIEVWVAHSEELKPQDFPFKIKCINHYFR